MTTYLQSLRLFLISRMGWIIYRWLWATWRIEVVESEELVKRLKNKKPVIFAHWHGHELVLMPMIKRYRLATMVSTSKDGQIMNYAVKKMSGVYSSGSSTRQGAQALLGLVRLMKRGGHSACVAVDGPKGPLHIVKPGVFELSKLTHAQIFSCGVAVDRAFVLEKSWNKAILPKPFAKIIIVFNPSPIDPEVQLDPRQPELQKKLAVSIHDAIQYAESQFAGYHS